MSYDRDLTSVSSENSSAEENSLLHSFLRSRLIKLRLAVALKCLDGLICIIVAFAWRTVLRTHCLWFFKALNGCPWSNRESDAVILASQTCRDDDVFLNSSPLLIDFSRAKETIKWYDVDCRPVMEGGGLWSGFSRVRGPQEKRQKNAKVIENKSLKKLFSKLFVTSTVKSYQQVLWSAGKRFPKLTFNKQWHRHAKVPKWTSSHLLKHAIFAQRKQKITAADFLRLWSAWISWQVANKKHAKCRRFCFTIKL